MVRLQPMIEFRSRRWVARSKYGLRRSRKIILQQPASTTQSVYGGAKSLTGARQFGSAATAFSSPRSSSFSRITSNWLRVRFAVSIVYTHTMELRDVKSCRIAVQVSAQGSFLVTGRAGRSKE